MSDIPAPLVDRIGHVGGIECLVIDEKIYYFGFDFGSDLVVSPMIEHIEVMAEFAHHYMVQRDGVHDAKYWLQLAKNSINNSSLTSLRSRIVDTSQLRSTAELIEKAAKEGSVLGEIAVEYHLLYLLGAAGGWQGPDLDDIEELMSQINDYEAPHSSYFIRKVALELQAAINELISVCPDNWATQFNSLNVSI